MPHEEPESREPEAPDPETRAGFVALIGRPNVGKSTLLNAILGERLSIVSPKAQTTRLPVAGILTEGDSQAIFLDTPGLLDPKDLHQHALLEAALETVGDADLLVGIADASRPLEEREWAPLIEAIGARGADTVLLALNKADAAPPGRVREWEEWATRTIPGVSLHTLSAASGEGVSGLVGELRNRLPPSPFLYPEDDLATQPLRFFVAEWIRETVFTMFSDEIPYATHCEVGEFRENEDPVYIQATLFVERDTQKRILIGAKGSAIRELGMASREKIERFIGRPVYLDLWVKVVPGWRRNRGHLQRFGYRVSDDAASSGR